MTFLNKMQEEELQRLIKKFSRWMKETEEEMGHDEFQNMLSSWANTTITINNNPISNPDSIAAMVMSSFPAKEVICKNS